MEKDVQKPQSGRSMDRRYIRRLLRLVALIIPLALIGNIIYLFISSDRGIFGQIGRFDTRFIFLAVALALCPWLGQSGQILIWGRIFRVGISPFNALKTVLAADIGAAITPTMLGGGYAKLGFLIGFGFSPARATLVTFLGTLADAVFFAIAMPVAVYLTCTWKNPHILRIWNDLISHWPIATGVLLVIIAVLLTVRKFRLGVSGSEAPRSAHENLLIKIRRWVRKFRDDLVKASRFVAGNGKKAFLACVLLSGLGWIGRYGAITALVAGLGYPADPVLFFILQWVVFTTMTLIPTPGAIGGAEVSFSLIYSGLIPPPAIPLVTATWRFVTFYVTVGLASIIFAFSKFEFLQNFEVGRHLTDEKSSAAEKLR